MLRVVLDTNVVVAGLRSSSGASYLLLAALRARRFIAAVSNPLCLEYLDVLSRPDLVPVLAAEGAEAWLDGFLVLCQCCHVSFLFRPTLADADDDRVLEAALAGQASYIVTHNVTDFAAATGLGITPVTPGEFLAMLAAP